jgi:hypothetical protein
MYEFFNKRRVTLQDMNDMQTWIGQDIRNYIGVHFEKGILRVSNTGLGDGYGNPRYSIGLTFDITPSNNAGGTVYNIPLPTPGLDAIYFVDSEGHLFGIYDNINYNATPTVFDTTGNMAIPFTSAVGGGGDGDYYVWASYKDLAEPTYIKQDKSGGTYYPKKYEGYAITTVFNNPAQPSGDYVFCGKITKAGTTLTADCSGQVYAGMKQEDVNIFVEVNGRPATYAVLEHKSLKDHIDSIGHGVVYNSTFTSPFNPHGTHPDDMAQVNTQNITDYCIIESKLSRTTDPGGAAVGTLELQDASVTGQKIALQTISQANLSPDLVPIGAVTMWAGTYATIPNGWELCDGSILPAVNFPALFSAIGTQWGVSAGNVVLPDLRYAFIRGAFAPSTTKSFFNDPDVSSRIQMGNGLVSEPGSVQLDSLQQHQHASPDGSNFVTDLYKSSQGHGSDAGSNSSDVKTGNIVGGRASSETRPVNAYLFYIIRVL